MSQTCRFCGSGSLHSFCDLGETPLANAFPIPEQEDTHERVFPLHAWVCAECFLVQLPEVVSPAELFSDYAYFSSYADSWLAHCRQFADAMVQRFSLDAESLVLEVASNDGHLLKNFRDHGVGVLGIEPAANVARVAQAASVPTRVAFFSSDLGRELGEQGVRADLLVGNNVLAHVPDLNDFLKGLKSVLKDDGIVSMEFPHLLRLLDETQFDTIYHEHFSYFSCTTAQRVFAAHGLEMFDVEEMATHGGSLRVFVRHGDSTLHPSTGRVGELLAREKAAGLGRLETYMTFGDKVQSVRRALRDFLIRARREGKRVAGYGAPAKGNTLLNYCGVTRECIDFTVDRSPYKQGRVLPGSGIPVHAPDMLDATRPDFVLILPWNLQEEVCSQLPEVRNWGGRFVVPIPELRVLP